VFLNVHPDNTKIKRNKNVTNVTINVKTVLDQELTNVQLVINHSIYPTNNVSENVQKEPMPELTRELVLNVLKNVKHARKSLVTVLLVKRIITITENVSINVQPDITETKKKRNVVNVTKLVLPVIKILNN